MQPETAHALLEWAIWCEKYLRHPDVREVTRHFSIPPNLINLNEIIEKAQKEQRQCAAPGQA